MELLEDRRMIALISRVKPGEFNSNNTYMLIWSNQLRVLGNDL